MLLSVVDTCGSPNPQNSEAPIQDPSITPTWYCRAGKRSCDIFISTAGLIVVSPLLLVLSIVVPMTSPGSVFYRQERVGKNGQLFKILKFRSMIANADRQGPGLTTAGDPRITKIGSWLRRMKLDELPQLWNVLRGDMSLVGPRPELPSYVASYDARQKLVLKVRPGITDKASIAYRWEEEVLATAQDPEMFYRQVVLPRKLDLNLEYARSISLKSDFLVLFRTVCSLFSLRPDNSPSAAISKR